MIIAVERGLSLIKEKLERGGYKTVYADEYSFPPDVYIYSGRRAGSMLYGAQEAPGAAFSNISASHYGDSFSRSLIKINASEKSFYEIERVLSGVRQGNYFY